MVGGGVSVGAFVGSGVSVGLGSGVGVLVAVGATVAAKVGFSVDVAVGDGAAQAATATRSRNVARVVLSVVCKVKENRWNMLTSLCAR